MKKIVFKIRELGEALGVRLLPLQAPRSPLEVPEQKLRITGFVAIEKQDSVQRRRAGTRACSIFYNKGVARQATTTHYVTPWPHL